MVAWTQKVNKSKALRSGQDTWCLLNISYHFYSVLSHEDLEMGEHNAQQRKGHGYFVYR